MSSQPISGNSGWTHIENEYYACCDYTTGCTDPLASNYVAGAVGCGGHPAGPNNMVLWNGTPSCCLYEAGQGHVTDEPPSCCGDPETGTIYPKPQQGCPPGHLTVNCDASCSNPDSNWSCGCPYSTVPSSPGLYANGYQNPAGQFWLSPNAYPSGWPFTSATSPSAIGCDQGNNQPQNAAGGGDFSCCTPNTNYDPGDFGCKRAYFFGWDGQKSYDSNAGNWRWDNLTWKSGCAGGTKSGNMVGGEVWPSWAQCGDMPSGGNGPFASPYPEGRAWMGILGAGGNPCQSHAGNQGCMGIGGYAAGPDPLDHSCCCIGAGLYEPNPPAGPTGPGPTGGPAIPGPGIPGGPGTGPTGGPGSTGTSCFIGETLITMADGTTKRIDEVEVGEFVKSEKETSQVKTIDIHKGEFNIYTINNSKYFVTEEHPFKTENGWKAIIPHDSFKKHGIEAHTLQIGDILIKNGTTEELKSIDFSTEKADTVYNLRLDNEHVYYADGYLVHNGKEDPFGDHIWDWPGLDPDIPGGGGMTGPPSGPGDDPTGIRESVSSSKIIKRSQVNNIIKEAIKEIKKEFKNKKKQYIY